MCVLLLLLLLLLRSPSLQVVEICEVPKRTERNPEHGLASAVAGTSSGTLTAQSAAKCHVCSPSPHERSVARGSSKRRRA